MAGLDLADKVVVVAGNGPSLAHMAAGRILAEDVIIRTNNFFFEPRYFLGRRVDLAFMGGDARVAPFMFETLYHCRQQYQVTSWSSHNPKVAAAGRKRFPTGFHPMKFRDSGTRKDVVALAARYGKRPTTGLHAVLHAHGLGARTIILAGFDFYRGRTRYAYRPGRNMVDLLGADLAIRGADIDLHDPDLDLEIIAYLQKSGDLTLYRAGHGTGLDDVLDLAPARVGETIANGARDAVPDDWALRSGIYPIGVLKTLRRASALLRQTGIRALIRKRRASGET